MGILIDLIREILDSDKKPKIHRALSAKNRSRKEKKPYRLTAKRAFPKKK